MSVSQYSPCPRCGFPDENLSGGDPEAPDEVAKPQNGVGSLPSQNPTGKESDATCTTLTASATTASKAQYDQSSNDAAPEGSNPTAAADKRHAMLNILETMYASYARGRLVDTGKYLDMILRHAREPQPTSLYWEPPATESCDHQWADYGTLKSGDNPTIEIEACVRCCVQRKKQQPPATEQEWRWKETGNRDSDGRPYLELLEGEKIIAVGPENTVIAAANAHNAALAVERNVLEAERKHNEATIVELEQQLAAERGRHKAECKRHIAKNRQVAEQLLAAQAAIAEHREALEWLRDFQNGCPLPSYEKNWNHAMALTDACLKSKPDLSALEKHDKEVRKPLVDALEKMPEVAYQTIIEHAGVTLENLPNEFQSICDDALAKVKEGK